MTNERELAARLLLLPSVEERLGFIERFGRKTSSPLQGELLAKVNVPECSSGLSFSVALASDTISMRIEAGSSLVHGLALVVCSPFQGAIVAEAITFRPTVLETVGVWNALSFIRQAGITGLLDRLQAVLVTAARTIPSS